MEEHWPAAVFLLGATGGIMAWLKRQLIDNVYATKEEVNAAIVKLEEEIVAHEKKVEERYNDIYNLIADNHDEIKDLIISQLSRK